MNVAEKIVALRRGLGMSQAAFGLKLGYSGAQISRIESGTVPVKDEVLLKICSVFDIPSESMLGDGVELPVKQNFCGASVRLVLLRKEMGLSQVEFASLVGCPQSMLSRLECGKSDLSPATARRIAAACNVGVDWLLYGDEKKKRFPIDDDMLEYLWAHEDVRKMLYELKS